MKIGIVGTGRIGSTLGEIWGKAGHTVIWGTRDPGSPGVAALVERSGNGAAAVSQREAVERSEVVLLAIPWKAVDDVLESIGDAFDGRTVLDATNAVGIFRSDGAPSAAEAIADALSGSRVVKCFNTTGFNVMADPRFGESIADMFYCADGEEEGGVAERLIADAGMNPVYCGPVSNSRLLESLAELWIQLAMPLGYGRDIAFKLLRRPDGGA